MRVIFCLIFYSIAVTKTLLSDLCVLKSTIQYCYEAAAIVISRSREWTCRQSTPMSEWKERISSDNTLLSSCSRSRFYQHSTTSAQHRSLWIAQAVAVMTLILTSSAAAQKSSARFAGVINLFCELAGKKMAIAVAPVIKIRILLSWHLIHL